MRQILVQKRYGCIKIPMKYRLFFDEYSVIDTTYLIAKIQYNLISGKSLKTSQILIIPKTYYILYNQYEKNIMHFPFFCHKKMHRQYQYKKYIAT
jgi:hypothetical protein